MYIYIYIYIYIHTATATATAPCAPLFPALCRSRYQTCMTKAMRKTRLRFEPARYYAKKNLGDHPPSESFKCDNRCAIGYCITVITEYGYVNDNAKKSVFGRGVIE